MGRSRQGNGAADPSEANPAIAPRTDALAAEPDVSETGCERMQRRVVLFDYLVGAGEQRLRDREAEHAGGLDVDDQFEPRRLHHRQLRGLGTLEDAAGIGADLTKG